MDCAACGAQMPDNAGFCPACGRTAAEPPPAPAMAGGVGERLMAVLAYFTFIPAIILLLVEPHKRNRYIRFHALQCIFASAGLVVLFGISLFLFITPLPGHLFWLMLCLVLLIGCFILWLVLMVKAFQGEVFKLPMIGEWAERQANLV